MSLRPDEPKDRDHVFDTFDDSYRLFSLNSQSAIDTRKLYEQEIRRHGITVVLNDLLGKEKNVNSLSGLVNNIKDKLLGKSGDDEGQERDLKTISIAEAVILRIVQDNLLELTREKEDQTPRIADEYASRPIRSLPDFIDQIVASSELSEQTSTKYMEFLVGLEQNLGRLISENS